MADITKKEVKTWFDEHTKSKDFEKLIRKIISQAFVDFLKLQYDNRNFLKNKI